jgi:predicted phosphodiesterase
MPTAILSDIHGNLEALQAVLEICEQQQVTEYWCLGDVIGYGPNPTEVAAIALERFSVSLMGNHEEALVTGRHRFNPYAAQAIDWTRAQLSSGNPITRLFRGSAGPDYLDWFKKRRNFELRENILMVHGSIYDPVHDYVDEPENPVEAEQMIQTLSRDFTGFDLCFAGHNHTPFLSTPLGTIIPHDDRSEYRLPKGHKAYVCVGSVGQPRDRDYRASFAILDGERLTFYRLPYDVETTQRKILEVGLHPFLAERLGKGL